jgi:DNA polymerase-3 subunit epsilon
MRREIVFDTETTGLSPLTGDRVVELGCVELINHIPTGRHFHAYFNPERSMPEEAFRVHGLSEAFLADKPRFRERAEEFIAFVGDDPMIAHNAPFDVTFLNAELERINRRQLRNEIIDTVELARVRHPGARVSLDSLCKHYGIDNSRRALHGALLDAQILSEVYLELIGGRQVAFALTAEIVTTTIEIAYARRDRAPRPVPLARSLDEATLLAHASLVATLGSAPLWAEYA